MTEQELDIILFQLQSGKTFLEFLPGENRYYFFDTINEQFYCRKLDAVINNYNLLFRISKGELKFNFRPISKEEFEKQGFEFEKVSI